jgi:transposase-like protein
MIKETRMKTIDHAVRDRILELLKEQNRTISDLCLAGGLTPSTLYDFMRGDTEHIQLNTVKQVCMGFDIKMATFFDKAYFDDYE